MTTQIPRNHQRVRRYNSAFTIVEILVVIAIVGILATLTLIGFSRFQAESRDTQRSAKATVITEALEKYYDQNGEYPSCADITKEGDVVKSSVLEGIDTASLKTPQGSASDTNSIECQSLTSIAGDFFEYEGDGTATCEGPTGTGCLEYTLRYREDSTGEIKSITSRRVAKIASSGPMGLTGTPSFTQVSLTWNAVPNATGYYLERDTNASYTNGLANRITLSSSTLGTTISSLSAGTTYYFRIKPIAQSSEGVWTTFSTTTLTLSAPSLTLSASGTTLTADWNAITNASGYEIQCSTNGSTWPLPSSGCANTTTSSSTVTSFSGRTPGETYSVRVRAVHTPSSYSGPWSTVQTQIIEVSAPTGVSCSQVSGQASRMNVNWTASSGASSYLVQLSTSSTFSSIAASATPGSSATSHQFTSGLDAGTRYYCRVYAYAGSVPSDASNVGNAITWIGGGYFTTFSGGSPSGVRHSSAGNWVGDPGCPNYSYWSDGCGNYYHEYVTVNGWCPAGSSFRYNLHAYYRNASGSWTGDHKYTGTVGPATWYTINAYSPYYSAFDATAWCDGPQADSGTFGSGTVMY